MISKKDLVCRMDDICDELNALRIRVTTLEKKNLKKDFKKLEKNTADKPKRGRGRPRKTDK